MAPTLPALPLRPPENRVDPRAVGWWTTQALVQVVVVVAAQLLAALTTGPGWLLGTGVGTALLGAGYVLVMPRWRYAVHHWEADQHAVYTLAGWLRLQWRVAPISRIQTIDTAQSPLQRLFGLASVTVTTASSAGALRIDGLAMPDAEQLVHRLTEITRADPGDAT
jgi:uncharacterized protein